MATTLITLSIVLLSLLWVVVMLFKLHKEKPVVLSSKDYIKLVVSGFIAFIADTLGVGSFSLNVTLAKLLGTFSDDELPGLNNGAQVIPGAIESLFFMHLIEVDLTTLLTLIAGACLGGLLGGVLVSRLSKQGVRLAMIISFFVVIVLLICHQFRLLPVGGDLTELHSWRLAVGFLALLICGALTSAGVGLFVMVQGVLFVLNISPAVAFPLMTTAGAMQQPLTALVLLRKNKIPLKKTLILSSAGCFGVLITLPLFTYLTITWLHLFLLCILIYNFFSIGYTYLQSRKAKDYSQPVLVRENVSDFLVS